MTHVSRSMISIMVLIMFFGSGCIENDGKGDIDDRFLDSDGDGVWDRQDPNPNLNIDTDGDGLSDDWETVVWKTDPNDPDTDGDGWNDMRDMYPFDPTLPCFPPDSFDQIEDSDLDGYPDDYNKYPLCFDRFPFDETQWSDRDSDGLGDNPYGNNPDPYPFDPNRYS